MRGVPYERIGKQPEQDPRRAPARKWAPCHRWPAQIGGSPDGILRARDEAGELGAEIGPGAAQLISEIWIVVSETMISTSHKAKRITEPGIGMPTRITCLLGEGDW